MNFKKFVDPDNREEFWINMDLVVSAFPDDRGNIILDTMTGNHFVQKEQFEKSIAEDKKNSHLESLLVKLIDALNRLTIHIPTSIRLHM